MTSFTVKAFITLLRRVPLRLIHILGCLTIPQFLACHCYAFNSCQPPSLLPIVAAAPANCLTGHYQITIAGLNLSTFSFSPDALMLVASANIGVDGAENYWVLNWPVKPAVQW